MISRVEVTAGVVVSTVPFSRRSLERVDLKEIDGCDCSEAAAGGADLPVAISRTRAGFSCLVKHFIGWGGGGG